MKQFFVQKIGEKGFLVSDGQGLYAKKLGAFTCASDLLSWINQELVIDLLKNEKHGDAYPSHLDWRHIASGTHRQNEENIDLTSLDSKGANYNHHGPFIVDPRVNGGSLDGAGEPESIGEVAERVVRRSGQSIPKPMLVKEKHDHETVTVVAPCKPDGSDLEGNLLRETKRLPLTKGQQVVLHFFQAVIAKHGNDGIQFDYATVAQKTEHTENFVKNCVKLLGIRGDLVLDVRSVGHEPFISLPVPEQYK